MWHKGHKNITEGWQEIELDATFQTFPSINCMQPHGLHPL